MVVYVCPGGKDIFGAVYAGRKDDSAICDKRRLDWPYRKGHKRCLPGFRDWGDFKCPFRRRAACNSGKKDFGMGKESVRGTADENSNESGTQRQ